MDDMKSLEDVHELQLLDSAIDHLLDERANLPQLEKFKTVAGSIEELKTQLKEQQDVADATRLEVQKSQGEMNLVEDKRTFEERRLYAGGMSAKDTQNLQLEIEMLGRQIDTFEEEILAKLDVREEQDKQIADTQERLSAAETEFAKLESDIALAWKAIDEEVAKDEAKKAAVIPRIDPEVLELYEDMRARPRELPAVGRLEDDSCGACNLRLSNAEQDKARSSYPPRCVHCRAILVVL